MIFLVLLTSLLQAAISTVISLLCALPLACFCDRFSFPGKRIVLSLAPLLAIMPMKLVALSIQIFFGFAGLPAIIVGHCMLNIPFAFYMLHGAYQKSNPLWSLIARQLGATRWQAYKDIYVPFLRPTISSAAILIFILCFTSFSLPMVLGSQPYHMTPDIMIYHAYQHDNYSEIMLYFIVRLLVLLPLITAARGQLQSPGWQEHHLGVARYERYHPRKHGWAWCAYLFAVGICTLGPLVMLLVAKIDSSVFVFWHSIIVGAHDILLGIQVYKVILHSLLLACASGICAVIVGYGLHKLMMRTKNRWLQQTLDSVTSTVFILGSVGCGILCAQLTQTSSLPLFIIATLCHVMLNFPFAYRIIKTQMIAWEPDWDLSAQSYGASSRARLRTLELPFLRGSFLQALCVCCGLSLTEIGAGSILHDATGITLPMAIKIYRDHGMHEGVIGLSVVLMLIVLAVSYIFN